MGFFTETGPAPRAKDAVRILAGIVAGGASLFLLFGFLAMAPLGSGAASIVLASMVRLACWRPWPRQGGEPLVPPELAILGLHRMFGSWCERQGSFCPLSETGHLYAYASIWAASGVAHFLGTLPLVSRQAKGAGGRAAS